MFGLLSRSARIRTAKILDLSADLSMVIEIVDEEVNVKDFQRVRSELFDQAGGGGLVTLENIRVIHYRPEKGRLGPPTSASAAWGVFDFPDAGGVRQSTTSPFRKPALRWLRR